MPLLPKKPSRPKRAKSKPKPSTYRARKFPVRLAYHHHTGRHLPLYCTSYAALFALIVFAASLVLFVSWSAKAVQQSGSITVSGNIVGDPPDTAANIISPANNSRYTNSQLTVSGNCLPGVIVEIYRNDVFAGDTLCTSGGTFELTITMVPDHNRLIAKSKDSANQYGPDSEAANVYYDVPAAPARPGSPPSQSTSGKRPSGSTLGPLLVYTEPVQKRTVQGQNFTLKYEIDGDRAPYAVSIDWGDGSPATLVSQPKEGDFEATHKFTKPGQLTVRISVLGGGGGQGSIQTIVFVVPGTSAGIAKPAYADCNALETYLCISMPKPDVVTQAINRAWIAIIITALMTASFWFGEKVIYDRLSHKGGRLLAR